MNKVALSNAMLTRTLARLADYAGDKTLTSTFSPDAVKKFREGVTNIPKTGISPVDRATLRTAASSGLSTRRHVRRFVKGLTDDVTRSVGTNLHNVAKETKGFRHISKIPGARKVMREGLPFAKNVTYKAITSKPAKTLMQSIKRAIESPTAKKLFATISKVKK